MVSDGFYFVGSAVILLKSQSQIRCQYGPAGTKRLEFDEK